MYMILIEKKKKLRSIDIRIIQFNIEIPYIFKICPIDIHNENSKHHVTFQHRVTWQSTGRHTLNSTHGRRRYTRSGTASKHGNAGDFDQKQPRPIFDASVRNSRADERMTQSRCSPLRMRNFHCAPPRSSKKESRVHIIHSFIAWKSIYIYIYIPFGASCSPFFFHFYPGDEKKRQIRLLETLFYCARGRFE